MRPRTEPQHYDNTLKALFGDEAAQILPQLLSETELAGEQNIGIDRSKLKTDLVYNIKHKGLPHILNMELQTDADSTMHIRLLQYHHKYCQGSLSSTRELRSTTSDKNR